jgi:hypothetical protein
MRSAFLAALLLAACATIAPLGRPVSIGYGRNVTFPGDLQLEFTSVVSDSRCPVNVVCIQKGDVVVELTATQGGETQRVRVSLDEPQAQVFGHRLELRAVEPPPVTPPRPHSAYSATVLVM